MALKETVAGNIWCAELVITIQKRLKSENKTASITTIHLFVLLSVFGPQGLRLVQLTDVSLLVEWEPVLGAEYYILTHHPKNDKRALQQVVRVQMPIQQNSKF